MGKVYKILNLFDIVLAKLKNNNKDFNNYCAEQ